MPRSSNDLARPEHLDRALYFTTPQGWLALVTLVAMLGGVVAWAILGEIVTYVEGDGIVMSRGGRPGADLDVQMYVSIADGKRVRPGMPARVSPNPLPPVEYGYLTGTVESISEFPAGVDGMAEALQNRALAEVFSRNGPPYSGRIALNPDAATASGFAWTSARGAPEEITAGTVARVEIEVERRPPITLVMPRLGEGLDD